MTSVPGTGNDPWADLLTENWKAWVIPFGLGFVIGALAVIFR